MFHKNLLHFNKKVLKSEEFQEICWKGVMAEVRVVYDLLIYAELLFEVSYVLGGDNKGKGKQN